MTFGTVMHRPVHALPAHLPAAGCLCRGSTAMTRSWGTWRRLGEGMGPACGEEGGPRAAAAGPAGCPCLPLAACAHASCPPARSCPDLSSGAVLSAALAGPALAAVGRVQCDACWCAACAAGRAGITNCAPSASGAAPTCFMCLTFASHTPASPGWMPALSLCEHTCPAPLPTPAGLCPLCCCWRCSCC